MLFIIWSSIFYVWYITNGIKVLSKLPISSFLLLRTYLPTTVVILSVIDLAFFILFTSELI